MPSSVIAAMHYDPVAHKLRVIYVSGMVYDYLDVPEAVYARMKQATSKGKFLNEQIKGKFEFIKIEN